MLWMLVGVTIINWSITLYAPASYFAPIALLVVFAGLWGLGVAILSWLDLDSFPSLRRWENRFAWANALIIVVLMGAWTYIQFHNSPGYSTDEQAFDQYAAQLVAHGLHNPYTHSMAPAFPLYRLSPAAYSYTLIGDPVKLLSYPALSFLVYVPFILLGWSSEVGAAVNVMAWVASFLLIFALVPRSMRAGALVLSSVSVYLAFAVGGVTDMLFIPVLIVGAYKWDRFERVPGWRSYAGPVAVGLAMSIKQTPWPVLAFVLCALALDEYDVTGDLRAAVGRAWRYLRIVVVIFLIPNLPYLIASPSAWFRGVFTPFTQNLVPSGQGLISLTLFVHMGGGSLTIYTVALILVAVLLLVLFVGTYPLLRPATFMLASVVYFFAARSQTNYLVPLIPVAVVGAITAGPATRRLATDGSRLAGVIRGRAWRRASAGVAIVTAAAIIYALVAPSPLSVKITGIQTTGYLGGIKELSLRVHNGTDGRLKPAYTLQTNHGDTTFWDVWKGPTSLSPGQTATVQIVNPNYQSEVGLGDGFSVLAFTSTPSSTVSVSHRFLLNLWKTGFIPQAFNTAEPIGKKIRLQVEILDHFDDPVDIRGIPVRLGELEYTGFGFKRGTAIIIGSGGRRGRTNIVAYTNKRGVATFYIIGTVGNRVPISFSGHLRNQKAKYVYGSTGLMDIRFKK
jgi:hypothetical protein